MFVVKLFDISGFHLIKIRHTHVPWVSCKIDHRVFRIKIGRFCHVPRRQMVRVWAAVREGEVFGESVKSMKTEGCEVFAQGFVEHGRDDASEPFWGGERRGEGKKKVGNEIKLKKRKEKKEIK